MGISLKNALEEGRTLLRQGATNDEIIVFLYDHGVTIVDSIAIMDRLLPVGFPAIKMMVSYHPVWKSTADASEALHKELIESLKEGDYVEHPDGYFTYTQKT